ncbi:MAG: flagellar protein FlgN [Gemmatimonadales bacterium]|nr:flagellar protein FlgN [Gemmatimonadales bacterium]
METQGRTASLIKEDGQLLASLLEIEDRNYRRLLRLAWRQNSYMRRQNVDRLETNAQEWSVYLPRANEARIARERFVGEMGDSIGRPIPPNKMTDILHFTDADTRRKVFSAIKILQDTTMRLARQNDLNRNLAEYCLDLAGEESKMFQRCLTEDPDGCYDGDAKPNGRGPGGVLHRQA